VISSAIWPTLNVAECGLYLGQQWCDAAGRRQVPVIIGSPIGSPAPAYRQELSCGATVQSVLNVQISLALIVRRGVTRRGGEAYAQLVVNGKGRSGRGREVAWRWKMPA
jgi:hypothetical protein